jgi:hypothetical protein
VGVFTGVVGLTEGLAEDTATGARFGTAGFMDATGALVLRDAAAGVPAAVVLAEGMVVGAGAALTAAVRSLGSPQTQPLARLMPGACWSIVEA